MSRRKPATVGERAFAASLTAAEVAARLGVKLDTVYAYVSRGLLTRVPGADGPRRFDAAQVERLSVSGRRTVTPKPEPLLITTAIAEVSPDGLHYRGQSALALARSARFEQVAEWLWASQTAPGAATAELAAAARFEAPKAAVALARSVQSALPEDALPLERLRVIGTVLGSVDPLRYDTSPAPVVATARSLIAGLIASLPRMGERPGPNAGSADELFAQLSAARPTRLRVRALEAAMCLCADHALSPSTLAVRVAASQRADPYAVVQTGLGALSGALHGAASLSAEELIGEVEAGQDPSQVIGARLRRGQRIPGFGHALHASGDPRAQLLLELVSEAFPKRAAVDAERRVRDVMRERVLPPPNIDWALAALARAADMVRGSSEAIMAIARVAGWIAHALEEYAAPTKFPWRTLYVGPPRAG